MLKTHVDNQIRLVQQPQHAQVSGYLAAHWGGLNGFARPGHYLGAKNRIHWRDAVILGIAEHDNGWSEWETVPRISSNDGLPVGLGEQSCTPEPAELAQWRSGGYDRWREGIARLAGPYPYAGLLVSLHAYWLYAVEFDEILQETDEVFRHFVFHGREGAPPLVSDKAVTRAFLEEQVTLQKELKKRILKEPGGDIALKIEHLGPHVRLLQLMDSLSLYLALNDRESHSLEDVPRASWEDRITLEWNWIDAYTAVLDPYPFDLDPLPVPMPARMVSADDDLSGAFARIHSVPMETIDFVLRSKA